MSQISNILMCSTCFRKFLKATRAVLLNKDSLHPIVQYLLIQISLSPKCCICYLKLLTACCAITLSQITYSPMDIICYHKLLTAPCALPVITNYLQTHVQ